jgi:glycosyltransferase involved in cell wall biosynthesis
MNKRTPARVAKTNRSRPLIAFFDYPDVFEDFYPHYGIDQKTFATEWADSGNHAFLGLIQSCVGDVTWYSFSIAPELEEARHQVTGCRVRFLPSSWLHRRMWRAFYLPRMAWRWQGSYRWFATLASYVALLSVPFLRTLWRDRPDYFFVQDYASGRFDVLLLLARCLGIPLIAYHAGSRPEHYLGRLAKQWTIPRADKLIASGNGEREILLNRFHVSPSRLTVILTPIDTSVFRPLDRDVACRSIDLMPDRRYLLFVGRLDDQVKRITLLIDTFSALSESHPSIDLLIVGEGRDGKQLAELASKRAPDRIRFFGWVSSGADLAPFYNVADCLVLPSRREGFPTVVGEAMACGTPVLASRVGAVGELVVDGKTGWTFTADDTGMFGERLSFVMSHTEMMTSMRREVRCQAEHRVSPGAVAAALQQCFSERKQKHD